MDDRLADLAARFGDRIEDWPAPHRQAAMLLRAGGPERADLFTALCAPTDEQALGRAVLTRLAEPVPPRPQPGPGLMLGAYAALLLIAGGLGYGFAPAPDDPLLALAFGDVSVAQMWPQ